MSDVFHGFAEDRDFGGTLVLLQFWDLLTKTLERTSGKGVREESVTNVNEGQCKNAACAKPKR